MEFDGSDHFFNDLLLNCCLLSKIVYLDDPCKMLNQDDKLNSINHSLGKIAFPQIFKDGDEKYILNDLPTLNHIISRNDESKRVIVAFRGTSSISDKLKDVCFFAKHFNEYRVHSGFFKKANKVPTNFFKKMVNDGYKIIFTGHSLGGATAALVATKLIKEIQREHSKNIIVLTFGCPSFADHMLAKDLEDLGIEKQYIHIQNKKDNVARVFDLIAQIFFQKNEDEDCFEDILESLLVEFIEKLSGEINKEVLDLISKLLSCLKKSIVPNYYRAGLVLLYEDGKLIKYEKEHFEITLDVKDFCGFFENHSMEKYYFNIMTGYLSKFMNINLIKPNNPIDFLKDLELYNDESYIHDFKKTKEKTYITLSVRLYPVENSEYLIGGMVKVGEHKIQLKQINNLDKIEISYNNSKSIDLNDITLSLFAYFNLKPIDIVFRIQSS